jgi:hypothetical protein
VKRSPVPWMLGFAGLVGTSCSPATQSRLLGVWFECKSPPHALASTSRQWPDPESAAGPLQADSGTATRVANDWLRNPWLGPPTRWFQYRPPNEVGRCACGRGRVPLASRSGARRWAHLLLILRRCGARARLHFAHAASHEAHALPPTGSAPRGSLRCLMLLARWLRD